MSIWAWEQNVISATIGQDNCFACLRLACNSNAGHASICLDVKPLPLQYSTHAFFKRILHCGLWELPLLLVIALTATVAGLPEPATAPTRRLPRPLPRPLLRPLGRRFLLFREPLPFFPRLLHPLRDLRRRRTLRPLFRFLPLRPLLTLLRFLRLISCMRFKKSCGKRLPTAAAASAKALFPLWLFPATLLVTHRVATPAHWLLANFIGHSLEVHRAGGNRCQFDGCTSGGGLMNIAASTWCCSSNRTAMRITSSMREASGGQNYGKCQQERVLDWAHVESYERRSTYQPGWRDNVQLFLFQLMFYAAFRMRSIAENVTEYKCVKGLRPRKLALKIKITEHQEEADAFHVEDYRKHEIRMLRAFSVHAM